LAPAPGIYSSTDIPSRLFVTGKKRSNPLALVVLVQLFERPMHPYEMVSTLRARHTEESIKIRIGSLYTVIQLLLRDGLIAPRETARNGRRPERTVYSLTASGRTLMREWMREIVGTPIKEYPQFEAGLSLLAALPPDEAIALLKERSARLGERMKLLRACLDGCRAMSLAPLFVIEVEYQHTLLKAEREFVNKLVRRIVQEEWGAGKRWKACQAMSEIGMMK
jgi:DNA-binding PadR family transcriptional regulator